MAQKIWVYLEMGAEGVSESSLQALFVGYDLAKALNRDLEGIGIAGSVDHLRKVSWPNGKIYHLTHESLTEYTASAYGAALESLIGVHNPSVLLFPSSTQGEDLASWLGAGLGAAVVLGAREIRQDADSLIATRVEFEEKIAVSYALRGTPVIASIEEGSVEKSWEEAGEAEIERVSPPITESDSQAQVVLTEVAGKAINLRDARVIVGIGAGVGNKELFNHARTLAEHLGGEIGATRAAVDAGWVSYDRQIGQTGVKVKPDLYVALGISGAVQHRVGILEAGTIVAVNIDPQAPIFRFSHYCVEGELEVFLPKLNEILRR